MAKKMAVVLRIFTVIALLVLFGFHFADFAINCETSVAAATTTQTPSKLCEPTWFNNQYRKGNYRTIETHGIPWWRSSLGITVFVFNILFIAAAVFFVVNSFIGLVRAQLFTFLKVILCVCLFIFAGLIVIARGEANSPIGFIAAVLFMTDTAVYDE
ncbi:hypothetical protein QR680_011371 [Steinernema hermaphroditum]|uniref:Uncharacterized protein n=1 Tax=Steinernema hermaphroditum TaxID=289476 RepID=A0AA39IUV3_9BILA|nr:hypothetical protein QR680_011371 [Steinernema hermaphroditum]